MNIYEKSASEIMKRGDRIVAEKKRKAAVIKKVSAGASCLCALIIGLGIWHGKAVKNAYENDKLWGNDNLIVSENDYSGDESITTVTTSSASNNIVITTETSSRISENTSITTAVSNNCISQTTVVNKPLQTTAVSLNPELMLQTREVGNEKVTKPASTIASGTSVQTTALTTQKNVSSQTTTSVVTTVMPIENDEYLFQFTESESGILYTKLINFESDELIDSYIKSESVVGYSELTDTEKSAFLELYTLDSISSEVMIGVKYEGQDDIILYRNVSYRPELLEDMIEDLGLKRYLTFISTDWYDLKNKEEENCVFDEDYIWENYFDGVYAERVSISDATETEYSQMLSITCKMPDTLPFEAKIEVRNNGYLTINLMGNQTAFYIGEEMAAKFIVSIKYDFFSW